MRYKQQLENRRLAQQQKEAQQAREMEQQRNKIEDRKKQLQKHLATDSNRCPYHFR